MEETTRDPVLWAALIGCLGGVAVTFAGFIATRMMSQNDEIKRLRKVLSDAHKTIKDQKNSIRDITLEWRDAVALYYFMRTEGMNVLAAAQRYLETRPLQFGDKDKPVVINEVGRVRKLFETTLPREEAQPAEEPNGNETAAAAAEEQPQS